MKDKITISSPLKRKLNKILSYLEDSEFEHFLGCLGEPEYKSHIFFDVVEIKRALSNKSPNCVQCERNKPITKDGLFCKECVDSIGLDIDKNGEYVLA